MPRGSGGQRSGSVLAVRAAGRAPVRLTGERPVDGATPDSLLALHAAGYREVAKRLGPGLVLDVGCGEGFESVRLAAEGRTLVGVDYSFEAASTASQRFGPAGLKVAQMDATALGLATASVRWACSSHLIEHFFEPERHVAELARVLADDGTAFFLTPNAPADFENPFHVHLFEPPELESLLGRYFCQVSVQGLDASPPVKANFTARRERARKLLRLDFLDLRHRIPRSWYIAAYVRLLPLAYRLMARHDSGGESGIDAEDFFVTDAIDQTTMVLFATGTGPRRCAS